MVLSCERCAAPTAKAVKCRYCSKMLCNSCIKSSKKVARVEHIYICKDCWTVMPKRKAFKSI
ncbi:MAG: hypothetical protein QW035_04505 [Candidatus Anstonellales archaeon]